MRDSELLSDLLVGTGLVLRYLGGRASANQAKICSRDALQLQFSKSRMIAAMFRRHYLALLVKTMMTNHAACK